MILYASLAALLWPSRASGEPLDAAQGTAQTAEIEVVVRGDTAGGYAARASADDGPRAPIDTASLIAALPGVHVRRLGTEGSFAALSVRGSASTQVGVFLAGIPLTSAADPSLDAGALPLWPGATFRVYRGFAPASLGTTGYLGGVLAIDAPADPSESARTSWWLAAGSFGALKLRIGDARTVGGVRLGTGLFAARSDGDFTYEVADPISGRLQTRTRANAGYVTVGAIERASIDLPWGSVGALVFADTRRQGLPGSALSPTTSARLETTRAVAGLDATARAGKRGAFRALLWGRREHAAFADPRRELDRLGQPSSAEDAIEAVGGSLGFRGQVLRAAPDPAPEGPANAESRPTSEHPSIGALTAGLAVDARGERFRPEGPVDNRIAAGRLAGGIGADLTWRAWPSLTIAGAARLDARRDRADASPAAGAGADGEIAPSGHLGASLAIAPAAILSVHAGALRRSPGFVELYGDRGALRGDPALRPERALSADAGLHGDVGDAGFQLGYELVGFATAAEDLIFFVPLGRGTFRAANLDRATLLGAEASVALTARGLRTSLSYTLLASRNTGDDPLTRGQPLPGRPAHDLAYDAAYRIGRIVVRYGLDAVAGTTVDAAGTIVLPARVLHGLGAAIDVPGASVGGSALRAAADVENLLDQRTFHARAPLSARATPLPLSDFLGYPLPGRTVWVTLRWSHM